MFVVFPFLLGAMKLISQTIVACHQYASFHSSSNFACPNDFIPERWLGIDPRFDDDKRTALQPFSLGPRSCPGKKFVTLHLATTIKCANSAKVSHIAKSVLSFANCCSISTSNYALSAQTGLNKNRIFSGISRHFGLPWRRGSRAPKHSTEIGLAINQAKPFMRREC